MKIVIRVVLLAVVLLIIVIATRPDTFHVERSTSIAAPGATVFARLDDFHQWADWSPWEKLDPQMKRTFEGPASGVGASYAWTGNDKVGEGRMTIAQSQPPSSLVMNLEFLKPFKATNTAIFTLADDGANTRVTWAMDGHQNFVSKAMCLVMSMDKAIGPDFERGLASLRTLAEHDAQQPAAQSPAPAPGH